MDLCEFVMGTKTVRHNITKFQVENKIYVVTVICTKNVSDLFPRDNKFHEVFGNRDVTLQAGRLDRFSRLIQKKVCRLVTFFELGHGLSVILRQERDQLRNITNLFN